MKMLLFMMIVVVSASLFFFEQNSSFGDDDDGSNEYQFRLYNPSTEESSIGLVSLPEQFEQNEFFTYIDEAENIALISNIGSQEFVCMGTCYCEELNNNNRKTIALPSMVRGVTYLMVAVSSIVAVKKSMEYFEERCKVEMSTSCDGKGSTKSEVDSCFPFSSSSPSAEESAKNEKADKAYKEENPSFYCEGNCMKKHYELSEPKRLSEEFGCEKLKTNGVVRIEVFNVGHTTKIFKKVHALSTFQKKYLTPFCESNSEVNANYNGRSGVKKIQLNLCTGSEKQLINKSIKCRSVDDESNQAWFSFKDVEKGEQPKLYFK